MSKCSPLPFSPCSDTLWQLWFAACSIQCDFASGQRDTRRDRPARPDASVGVRGRHFVRTDERQRFAGDRACLWYKRVRWQDDTSTSINTNRYSNTPTISRERHHSAASRRAISVIVKLGYVHVQLLDIQLHIRFIHSTPRVLSWHSVIEY